MGEPERRITAIERQKRAPNRVNVALDGTFAFGVPVSAIEEFGLSVGQVLTPLEIAELRALDETAKATETAIRLLTVRPRSVKEIQTRLRGKTYDESTVERVIARLRGWNYIDDDAFARYWVENRDANRPRGRRALEHELRAKGIDREIVSSAVAGAGIDELAGAMAIAEGKIRSYSGLDPAVARRRLAALLARRGYGYDIVKTVIERLLSEDAAGE